jgi:hypothetical protein
LYLYKHKQDTILKDNPLCYIIMDASLNIVELIENNPITKLSNSYNGKLLIKIKDCFTEFEQQLFVSSFYCFLNCDQNNDYVIDLDNIWKWLGFNQKYAAKNLLEKQFTIDVDYKILSPFSGGQVSTNLSPSESGAIKSHGGHNKTTIMLTVNAFKSLCLKAGTKKADEIHKYYMKMEEMIHQVVQEESDELRLQLEQKDNQLEKSRKAVEQATINQFPLNTECVYFGTIDNILGEERLIKFGQTNDLQSRVYCHRSKFDNFVLVNAFKVQNKVEIENLVKSHPKIKKQIRKISVGDKVYKEIISYDDTKFTIEKLSLYIKDVITSRQYSIDNFNLIMKQNEELGEALKEERDKNDTLVMSCKSKDKEISELNNILEQRKKRNEFLESENHTTQPIVEEDEQTKRFNKFVEECCFVNVEVEESSVNLEGQFRIWNQVKPTKVMFHRLKEYMDTRFRQKRLQKQDLNQIVHGYVGIRLKPIEYKPRLENNDTETFLFQVCRYSPSGKILNSKLLAEYQRWKKKLDKPTGNDDIKELKQYLNTSPYVMKATIWDVSTSNEGYYGLSLKEDDVYQHKKTSTNGKKVNKICTKSNQILNTWETIAKAANYEKVSAATMSRSVKNKTMYEGYYYSNNN